MLAINAPNYTLKLDRQKKIILKIGCSCVVKDFIIFISIIPCSNFLSKTLKIYKMTAMKWI